MNVELQMEKQTQTILLPVQRFQTLEYCHLGFFEFGYPDTSFANTTNRRYFIN